MPRIKIRDGEGMSNLINNSVLTEVEVDGTIKAQTRNVGKNFSYHNRRSMMTLTLTVMSQPKNQVSLYMQIGIKIELRH